jgi:hypothetical protein
MIVNILDGAIGYYHAPKCASRTIFAWAALPEDPGLIDAHPDWFAPSRRSEYTELRRRARLWPSSTHDWQAARTVPKVDAPIRFCVTRDPVARFVSGFTNRVLFHEGLGDGQISISDFIVDFDRLMGDERHRVVARHFLTQTSFYGRDPGLFTHIFNIGQLAELRALLEQVSGRRLPGDLRLQQSGDRVKPSLSDTEVERIKDIYAEDYAVFGAWF